MPERFLSLIVTMLPALHKIEERLDRETGRRFNAFDSLFSTDERATSRILAFLLDPTQAHGQGDVFLRAFIQRFVPNWQSTFNFAKARTALTHELIDVVISDGLRWLGIENKIFDAEEQERQAGRYLEELHGAHHQQDYRLVYLSPRGDGPSAYSLPPGDRTRHGANLVCGAWARPLEDDDQTTTAPASILDWLSNCRNQCEAENVAWLLKQFSAYVDSAIGGQKEDDMADTAVIALAQFNDQNLEAALRIGENFDAIRHNVARAFLICIQDRLKTWAEQNGEDWEILADWRGRNWIERPELRHLPILLRKRLWPALVGVVIRADHEGPGGVFIGVFGPTQDGWNEDEANNTRLYGKQFKFIGQETRVRISKALEKPLRGGIWVHYGKPLTDRNNHDISNWRDTEIVTRLQSERVPLSEYIAGEMTKMAAKIGDLVMDAT